MGRSKHPDELHPSPYKGDTGVPTVDHDRRIWAPTWDHVLLFWIREKATHFRAWLQHRRISRSQPLRRLDDDASR